MKLEKLSVFRPGQIVCAGEQSDTVGIIQIILNSLKIRYDCYGFLDVTFVYDEPTELAVRRWQKTNMISESGEVDEQTWNGMAAEFALTRDIE